MLVACLCIGFISCSKEEISTNSTDNQHDISQVEMKSVASSQQKEPLNSSLDISLLDRIKTSNGYLEFEDAKHFTDVLNTFNQSDDVLLKWTNERGIHTIESSYYNMINEIHDEISEKDEEAVYKKWADKVKINKDGTFERLFLTGFRWYVATSGLMKIGKHVYLAMPDKQITILDGDMDKLEKYKDLAPGKEADNGNVICTANNSYSEPLKTASTAVSNCVAVTSVRGVRGQFFRVLGCANIGSFSRIYTWEAFSECVNFRKIRGQFRKRRGLIRTTSDFNINCTVSTFSPTINFSQNFSNNFIKPCDNKSKLTIDVIPEFSKTFSRNEVPGSHAIIINNYLGEYQGFTNSCSNLTHQCNINL